MFVWWWHTETQEGQRLGVPYRCAATAACCCVSAAAAASAARCLAAASSASFFLRATHLLCWYTWKKVPTCIDKPNARQIWLVNQLYNQFRVTQLVMLVHLREGARLQVQHWQ